MKRFGISFSITGQKTASYFINIYYDDTKFELISRPETSVANGNLIKILWYDAKGGNGAKEGELDTLIFKAKENGIGNFIIDGELYTDKGQLIQTSFESVQVQVGKEETELQKQAKEEQGKDTTINNANLKSLRIDIEGMVPSFNTDIYKYDITVPEERTDIEVLAISENPEAVIEISGNTRFKRRTKFN